MWGWKLDVTIISVTKIQVRPEFEGRDVQDNIYE